MGPGLSGVRATVQAPIQPAEQARRDDVLRDLQARLGQETLAAELAAGEALSLDQAREDAARTIAALSAE